MKDQFRAILKLPFLEKIWSRFMKNRIYGTALTKFTPNHYSYQDPTLRKVTRNGVNYELNLANIVEWHLYFGFREVAREKLLQLTPNPVTILDVGANIGEVSFSFANKYPNATVYGFEPYPATFQNLKKNQSLNAFKNLHFHNIGLGAAAGEVHFEEREPGNPGMNRVTSNPEKSAHRIVITTLDSFITENQLSSVSIIKIDVEGYEHEVLKGATELLSKHQPILFIELDDSNLMEQGSNPADFIRFIQSFGYVIEHAETGEIITEKSKLKHSHFDIICKPAH